MRERGLEGPLCLFRLPGVQQEPPQREVGRHRLRVGGDGLPERGLGLLEWPFRWLEHPGWPAGSPRARGAMACCICSIAPSRSSVPARALARSASASAFLGSIARALSARPGRPGPAGEQQQDARLQLGVHVVRGAGRPRAPTRPARRRRSPAAGRLRRVSGGPARTWGPSPTALRYSRTAASTLPFSSWALPRSR